MKGFAAFVVAVLALGGAGCSGDDDDEQAAEGRLTPKLVDTTVVEGGSPDEQAVLRRVVEGMEQTTLQRIEIGRPGGRRGSGGEEAVPIEFTTVPGVTARGQWEEWIVAGALSRRLLAAGSPAEVDARDSRGAFTARAKLKGEPDPRPLAADREAAIVREIRNAAMKSGAGSVHLEVHRPYGLAVALSLTAGDPASFLKTKLRPLLVRLDEFRPRLEGLYLAVLDTRRRVALEWGSWTRNPAGSYWVRRDLAECSPIRQSDPPGTEAPPRCPV